MMTGRVTMDSSKWLLILSCHIFPFRARRKWTPLTFHAFSSLDGKTMLSVFSNFHHLSSCILCDTSLHRLAQFPLLKMPTTPCLFQLAPNLFRLLYTTTAPFSDLKFSAIYFRFLLYQFLCHLPTVAQQTVLKPSCVLKQQSFYLLLS